MKRYFSIFVILTLIFSHSLNVVSSETTTTVSEDTFLSAYEKVKLPFSTSSKAEIRGVKFGESGSNFLDCNDFSKLSPFLSPS